MGSTFLDLTNRVIRKINEVELTETSFASAKGMQALVKDSVLDALNELNQQKWEWPFHAVTGTQVLTIGQSEYLWPANFKSVDWQSFRVNKDDTLNVNNTTLKEIDIDEWYQLSRDIDYDNSVTGQQVPMNVFRSPYGGFGVTPSPNKAYTVSFQYYKNPTQLSLFSDTTDVPEQFNNILTFGALYHMNLFRENVEGVGIAQSKFKDGITNMYTILVKDAPPYFRDTRVNFGGGPTHYSTGAYHE
jgi:hypothetical protein